MEISVIVASQPQSETAWSVRLAYLRETPGCEVLIVTLPDERAGNDTERLHAAWTAGQNQSTGRFVHFTTDLYEPHPGWSDAALACIRANRVPSPTIWTPEGVPSNTLRDWSSAVESALPTASREQLATFGMPPTPDAGAEFAVRTAYAFTRIG